MCNEVSSPSFKLTRTFPSSSKNESYEESTLSPSDWLPDQSAPRNRTSLCSSGSEETVSGPPSRQLSAGKHASADPLIQCDSESSQIHVFKEKLAARASSSRMPQLDLCDWRSKPISLQRLLVCELNSHNNNNMFILNGAFLTLKVALQIHESPNRERQRKTGSRTTQI